jgi:hypothetical protein
MLTIRDRLRKHHDERDLTSAPNVSWRRAGGHTFRTTPTRRCLSSKQSLPEGAVGAPHMVGVIQLEGAAWTRTTDFRLVRTS